MIIFHKTENDFLLDIIKDGKIKIEPSLCLSLVHWFQYIHNKIRIILIVLIGEFLFFRLDNIMLRS